MMYQKVKLTALLVFGLVGCGLTEQPNLSSQEQLVQVNMTNITHTVATDRTAAFLIINHTVKNNGTTLPVGAVIYDVTAGGVTVPMSVFTGALAANASRSFQAKTLLDNGTTLVTEGEAQRFINGYRQRGVELILRQVLFIGGKRLMNIDVVLTRVVPSMSANWQRSGNVITGFTYTPARGTYTFSLTNNDSVPYVGGTWAITTTGGKNYTHTHTPSMPVQPGQSVTVQIEVNPNSALGTSNNVGSAASHGMWGEMRNNGQDMSRMRVAITGDVLQ